MVPFESWGTLSYPQSLVTVALSCIIFEIKRVIGRKSPFFTSLCIRHPRLGGLVEVLLYRLVRKVEDYGYILFATRPDPFLSVSYPSQPVPVGLYIGICNLLK